MLYYRFAIIIYGERFAVQNIEKSHRHSAALKSRLTKYIEEHYVHDDMDDMALDDIQRIFLQSDKSITELADIFDLFSLMLPSSLFKRKETFSELLAKILKKKKIKASELYHKAGITKAHFSKIKNNKEYQPSKATALALALAMELKLGEAEDLLERAGYTFSPSQVRDLVVKFFIEEGVYDVDEVNIQLHDRGEQPLTNTREDNAVK